MRRPMGAYSGCCPNCDSRDLWDDVTAYGCNRCGWSSIVHGNRYDPPRTVYRADGRIYDGTDGYDYSHA